MMVTAKNMRADLDLYPRSTTGGARMNSSSLARALVMSRPLKDDFPAMKQWRLCVDFIADGMKEKYPQFNRVAFIEKCLV